jgi:hypothetical protein
MSTILSPDPAGIEVKSETALPGAPVRRRRKAAFSALLLSLIGVSGFNAYVFSHAPRHTPAFGVSDVLTIYAQKQKIDERLPILRD